MDNPSLFGNSYENIHQLSANAYSLRMKARAKGSKLATAGFTLALSSHVITRKHLKWMSRTTVNILTVTYIIPSILYYVRFACQSCWERRWNVKSFILLNFYSVSKVKNPWEILFRCLNLSSVKRLVNKSYLAVRSVLSYRPPSSTIQHREKLAFLDRKIPFRYIFETQQKVWVK